MENLLLGEDIECIYDIVDESINESSRLLYAQKGG